MDLKAPQDIVADFRDSVLLLDAPTIRAARCIESL
jgi:hypothetical protein